ncbi:MAG: phospholipase A [Sphingomonadaceae bacterium]|nr:phospholipase A [Sphingomonadaceae bacterium]
MASPVQAAVRALVSVALDDPRGTPHIDVLFTGDGDAPERLSAPARISAELRAQNRSYEATLERVATASPPTAIPPGGFQRVSYRLLLPDGLAPGGLAMLSIPSLASNAVPFIVPQRQAAATAQTPIATSVEPLPLEVATVAEQRPTGNLFLPGLSAYQPIYGIAGFGTNTNVKLQLSFKYQLFGEQGAFGSAGSLLNGVQFAYTQRMYWDTQRSSLPFRNLDFQPELIYRLQSREREDRPTYGLTAGLRHESNGREGVDSRTVNIAYLEPTLATKIGGYDVSIGPRAWFYYGGQTGNEDIERYRGYTGFSLAVGSDDGLRLSSFSRYNFGSGKGSTQVDGSYPLNRLVWSRLNLYLYGQLFAGYGENMLDYDRQVTRARLGVAIVR